MSSIQGVQGSSAAIQGVPVTLKAPARAQAASTETPAQEAQETTAQTKAEAAKGDQQAARRLALATPAEAPASKVASSGGGKVDIVA